MLCQLSYRGKRARSFYIPCCWRGSLERTGSGASAKSSVSANVRKAVKQEVDKPRADFRLFPHAIAWPAAAKEGDERVLVWL